MSAPCDRSPLRSGAELLTGRASRQVCPLPEPLLLNRRCAGYGHGKSVPRKSPNMQSTGQAQSAANRAREMHKATSAPLTEDEKDYRAQLKDRARHDTSAARRPKPFGSVQLPALSASG